MAKSYPKRHPRVDYPVIPMPGDLEGMPDRTQCMLDRTLVAKKWRALEEASAAVIPFGFDVPVFPLSPLFDHLEGVSVTSPFAITASFQGGPGDGHLRFRAEAAGRKEPMLEALEVSTSAPAFIESLYLAFHLPTKCAYWHGRYGRNYTLLPSFHLLRRQHSFHYPGRFLPNYFKGKLDRPSGMRVAKRRGKFYVSCIAVYDFGDIVDMTVRIADGKATALWPPDVIFESGSRIIY